MKFHYCPICNQLYLKLIDTENEMICCEEPTEVLISNSEQGEHTPIIRKIGNFVTISVDKSHPIIDVHHISVIVMETNKGYQIKHLKINEEAKVSYILDNQEDIVNIYVFCNVHLLNSLY